MSDRQALNATFFAFRKREKSGVLLQAALGFVILAIVLIAAFIGAIYGVTGGAAFSQAAMAGQTDPDAIAQMMSPAALGGVMLIYLVFLFAFFVLTAAFEAACLRWLIRGESGGGFLGLQLGADTWRVYGVYWVWLIAFVIGTIVFALLLALLTGALGAVLGADSPFMLIPLLIAFIVPIYISVRLAPAAATSVAERKFAFFDAWKVSRERFWALFGAFLLLWLIYTVAVSIVIGMWMGATMVNVMTDAMNRGAGDPAQAAEAINAAVLNAMSTPTGLISYVVMQIASMALAVTFYIAMYGVNARAAAVALEEAKIEQQPAS
ncbi:hypothetical protein [Vitreimonas sp.]|uniref:hypothetical protein n=1 Tax=Vitreimonas sp. TaxID=3069702 RepID=UPI002ED89507